MGQTISLGLTYVCCTAAGSLCDACVGTTAPGTTGRKRSVLLLSITVAMALWFQYVVGPSIVEQSGIIWKMYRSIPGTGSLIYHAWYDSCEEYDYGEGEGETSHLLRQCAGNAGVYRVTFLSTLYFFINAIATHMVPQLNREAWPAKYTLFFFGLLITMFIPNSPLFSGFFLWVARLGAAAFVVLQQIILIDVAYNWNDNWVDRANEADRESYGSGAGWLQAIVGMCVTMYSLTILGIGLLYRWFDDCPENTWVITLTLLGIIAMTAIQVSSGTEGSLLTSSVLSLYAAYLAFEIVSKNPSGRCNPRLGENDVPGIIMGLILTTVSLAWTGWAWSAEDRLTIESVQSARAVPQPIMQSSNSTNMNDGVNLDVPFLNPDTQQATGLVTQAGTGDSDAITQGSVNIWKLNVVMALISCHVAMILTGWGTEGELDEHSNNAANPTVGRANMAILGISQWFAIGLYIWTLVAPHVFPDRDFS